VVGDGRPAPGRRLSAIRTPISRCQDGRIAEEWELTDTVGLLGRVGVQPAMAS
jgi:hypothetical protein